MLVVRTTPIYPAPGLSFKSAPHRPSHVYKRFYAVRAKKNNIRLTGNTKRVKKLITDVQIANLFRDKLENQDPKDLTARDYSFRDDKYSTQLFLTIAQSELRFGAPQTALEAKNMSIEDLANVMKNIGAELSRVISMKGSEIFKEPLPLAKDPLMQHTLYKKLLVELSRKALQFIKYYAIRAADDPTFVRPTVPPYVGPSNFQVASWVTPYMPTNQERPVSLAETVDISGLVSTMRTLNERNWIDNKSLLEMYGHLLETIGGDVTSPTVRKLVNDVIHLKLEMFETFTNHEQRKQYLDDLYEDMRQILNFAKPIFEAKETVRCLLHYARLLDLKDEHQSAIVAFQKTVKFCENTVAKEDRRGYYEVVAQYARFLDSIEDPVAITLFAKILREYTEPDLFLAQVIIDHSKTLEDQSEARVQYYKVLEMAEKLHDRALAGRAFHLLGVSYYAVDKAELAFECYEKAVDAFVDSTGYDSLEICPTLNNLAAMHFEFDDHAEALPIAQHAYMIRKTFLGPAAPLTLRSMESYGLILSDVDQARALKVFEKLEERLVDEAPSDIPSYVRLGNLFLHKAKLMMKLEYPPQDLASELRTSMLYLKKGEDYVTQLDVLNRLISCLEDDPEMAHIHARDAVAVCEKAYGPDTLELAHQAFSLGTVSYNLEKYDESKAAFQRVTEILEFLSMVDDPLYGEADEMLKTLKGPQDKMKQEVDVDFNKKFNFDRLRRKRILDRKEAARKRLRAGEEMKTMTKKEREAQKLAVKQRESNREQMNKAFSTKALLADMSAPDQDKFHFGGPEY